MSVRFILFVNLLLLPFCAYMQNDDATKVQPDDKVLYAKQLVKYVNTLYDSMDYNQAHEVANLAIAACEEAGLLQGVAQMLYRLGVINRIKGDNTKALSYLYASLEHYQSLNDAGGEASSLNQLGSIYRLQGNYPGALEHFLKSLSIFTEINDSSGRAGALNNIGIVHFYQNNLAKALEYYMASLELELALGREYGASISYINIGEVHKRMGNYRESLDYFLKGLVLAKKYEKEDKDGDGVGVLYNEIGSIYIYLGNYALSESYLRKALAIFEQIDNNQRLAECKLYLGELAIKQGELTTAKSFLNQALQHAGEVNALDLASQANKYLSEVYEKLNSIPLAYAHFKEHIAIRDSIFNEDNMKRMVQTEMLYEFDKQMHEAKIEQAKRDVKTQEQVKRQRELRNFLILILLISFLAGGVTYSAYRGKRDANILLAAQQEEILEKNEELTQQQEEILSQRDEIESKNRILLYNQQIIEAKNERIISSIEYAQTIQQAILPNREQLLKQFPNHLVFFKPKDIVSGDFYWCSSIGSTLFAAVVDCTGHGVPGAFMSLIGNTILNKIVNEWQTQNPAIILELMHQNLRSALNQDSSTSKAHVSMDICLIAVDSSRRRVTFAGASRPLFVVTQGEVKRIPGDPRSVGGFQREEKRYFTNHTVEVTEPSTLYLTTDGFMDQMDEKFKKYGQKRFAQLLLKAHLLPNNQQLSMLSSEYENHKQGQEQIDDICILGLKL